MEISFFFIVLLAAMLIYDPYNFVFLTLLCCILHEAAHIWMLRRLQGHILQLKIGCMGFVLRTDAEYAFSSQKERKVLWAGSACNLLLFFMSWLVERVYSSFYLSYFAICNLLIGLFNLLPVGILDGGRILYLWLLERRNERDSERILRVLTFFLVFVLCFWGGCLVILPGHNPTLLLTGLYLMVMSFCKT